MNGRFDLAGHCYVFITLACTVYGQMVLKWQMSGVGSLPADPAAKVVFLLKMVLNPWILSGFIAAFLASLSWMAAMTHLQMSYAYPFMSLAFVLVMVFGAVFFGEAIGISKLVGTLLVMAGLVVIARG